VEVYEQHYLAADDAPAQSGCGSGEKGWEIGRRPIVAAIHRPGTFLDVGCANGLLMESVVAWSPHPVEPYGLDFAPALVELARRRLPRWADRIFLGDVMEWRPPRRFDFVRTELVYAPAERRRELVERLLGSFVAAGGRLIVCGYGDPVREAVRSWGYEAEFELEWRSATGRLNELAGIGVPARE
jgi:trans-aconitate methyltransferase